MKVYGTAGEVVLYQPPAARLTPEGWEVDHGIGMQAHLDNLAPTHPGTPELDALEVEAAAARNRANAAARAKGRVRRYGKANGLTRLVTLTYASKRYGRADVVADLNGFFRRMREAWGGEAFPYVWVMEHHEDGSLHVHLALGRPVAMRCGRASCRSTKGLQQQQVGGPCLPCTWGFGFTDARRLERRDGSKAASSGRGAAVAVATYLTKYVAKAFGEGEAGAKRYEVGRGFQPHCVSVGAGELPGTERDVLAAVAAAFFGGVAPGFVWSSMDCEDWMGPPCRVAFW